MATNSQKTRKNNRNFSDSLFLTISSSDYNSQEAYDEAIKEALQEDLLRLNLLSTQEIYNVFLTMKEHYQSNKRSNIAPELWKKFISQVADHLPDMKNIESKKYHYVNQTTFREMLNMIKAKIDEEEMLITEANEYE